jgi:hypothetical protein
MEQKGRRTGMTVALWIVAICEVIRSLQNMAQIMATKHDLSQRDNAYAEFIKSLKQDDKQFVRNLLEEFEKQDGEQEKQIEMIDKAGD